MKHPFLDADRTVAFQKFLNTGFNFKYNTAAMAASLIRLHDLSHLPVYLLKK